MPAPRDGRLTVAISAAIMAHPKRRAMVEDLQTRLDRPVEVVWDEVNDRHDTGARAMAAFDPACSHHLVIQDDVVPCRDLLAGVEAAIAATPGDCPVVFYTGSVRPFRRDIDRAVARAHAQDASWITMRGIYWGPAVALPTAHIEKMLGWYLGPEGGWITNYDRRMSVWYAAREAIVWYSRPSLVDHRGDESLCGHPGRQRRAHMFLGADQSALDLAWSGPVVDLPYSAHMDDARQAAADAAANREAARASR